jgi:hypothetical protein
MPLPCSLTWFSSRAPKRDTPSSPGCITALSLNSQLSYSTRYQHMDIRRNHSGQCQHTGTLHLHIRRRHTPMLSTRRRKLLMCRTPLRNRLCHSPLLRTAYRQTLHTMSGQQRLLRPPRPRHEDLEMRPSDANLGLQKTRLEGLTTTTARQNARSRTSRLEQPPTQQKPGRAIKNSGQSSKTGIKTPRESLDNGDKFSLNSSGPLRPQPNGVEHLLPDPDSHREEASEEGEVS